MARISSRVEDFNVNEASSWEYVIWDGGYSAR